MLKKIISVLKNIFYVVMYLVIIIATFFLLFIYPIIIKNNCVKTIALVVTVVAIIYLFFLRKMKRLAYGLIELIIGLLMIVSIIAFPTESINGGLLDVPKLFGGIYIVIRGLDNIEKGIKSPNVLKNWEKIFKKRLDE